MSQDDKVNSLINQLKSSTSLTNKVRGAEEGAFSVPKEELEQFVIDNAGQLIQESFAVMNNYKDMINTAPNAEDVSAYAELIKASTNALESLNKILVQDKRSKTSMELKQIDIEQKKALIDHKADTHLLTMGREEMFKKLMDEAEAVEIIDADVVESDEPAKPILQVGLSGSSSS